MIEAVQGRPGWIAHSLLAGSLLLAGCPGGSSPPVPGTSKPQRRSGTPFKHPDFLDAPMLSEKQLTPEQMAEREKMKNQMIYLMDIRTAPRLEAADLLEAAIQAEAKNPGEYGEQTLRHHGLQVFVHLVSEDILDDKLARAILRLGEKLRQWDIMPLTMGVKAMVRSHDYLGEPEKGDALVDSVLEEARKARGQESQFLAASGSGSPQASQGAPLSPSPASGSGVVSPRVSRLPKGVPRIPDHEWRWLLDLKTTRLARRDFPAADAFLQAECETARNAMRAKPDAVKPMSTWLSLAGLRARVARGSGQTELADEIENDRRETVRKEAEAYPESPAHFAMTVAVRNEAVARLIGRDPEGARDRLTEIRSSVQGSRFAESPALGHFIKEWKVYDSMIAKSQFRHDLIGRPAPPFAVERWVHGGPLPLESLKDRVVLLAFCQVNLASSVELYPWLNSLHEEWHVKGLEIIQVVRPIRMKWNSKTKRAEHVRTRISLQLAASRNPDVTASTVPASDLLAPEQPVVSTPLRPVTNSKPPAESSAVVEEEVEMLEQLAMHYQHRFPTILLPIESNMAGAYGDKAPRSLVAIDRNGNVRAIEVYPTEECLRSIRETLQQLLVE